MSADRWEAYSGPLCDDPAELVGVPYDEAPRRSPLGNEPDWTDLWAGAA